MNEFHPLLKRLIKKHLQETKNTPEVDVFLEAVNRTFLSFERDKKITEHAFEVSEKEYQNVLTDLKAQYFLKEESISKIKDTLKQLDSSNEKVLDQSDDLIQIIDLLQKQVRIQKDLEQTLIDSKNYAESAARAKSDFLSVMSHEIRTPLNAIIGNIHILKQDEHLDSQVESIETLELSSHNLLSLINDILDFSKMEDGKVYFSSHSIDLHKLVKDIVSTYTVKALEFQNELTYTIASNTPIAVLGDQVRLNQILGNLISNAIKFTSKGKVELKVVLEKEDDDFYDIKFSVFDSGVGISERDQKLIFERFTQVDATDKREHGGSGLGLTITKKLLELQGSRIEVSSELNKGSEFFFTLKLAKDKSSKDKKPGDASKLDKEVSLAGMKILLVEDVTFNVIVIKKILTKWGVEVEVAENGQVAVEKVGDKTFDLILMDIQMPVMDGYAATKEIRKMGINTPVVALTASVSIESEEAAKASGMNDYLTKPINPKDLKEVLFKMTKGRNN
ncbi:Signal transduction histidine kinase [Spirosomataceae bacterium TFI 002]|nr:Signal transduction histidine kinase [Spirosomataceae bacterium TFI 002]